MEIYRNLSDPASKEFEKLLNSKLSKTKIEEGKIIDGKINKIIWKKTKYGKAPSIENMIAEI